MNLPKKLAEYDHTYITEAALQELIGEVDYRLFHHRVVKLVEENLLLPVKSAGNSGRIPALANKYRIIAMLKLYDLRTINIKLWQEQQDEVVPNATGELDVEY